MKQAKLVDEFRGVKVGDAGFKISYSFNGGGLHIFEGIVYEITDLGEKLYSSDHSIVLRSKAPCNSDHKEYMDSFGYPYVEVDGECFPLSFGCCLYSDDNSNCSFFARDRAELERIKGLLKTRVVDHYTEDF